MNASDYFERLHAGTLTTVIDDTALAPLVQDAGLQVRLLSEHDFCEPALVVLRTFAGHHQLQALWEEDGVLLSHLEQARLDSSLRCLSYALQQLRSIDAPAALARRRAVHQAFQEQSAYTIQTAAGQLTVHPQEELELVNDSNVLEPGWVYGVSEFLEAAIVNIESERSSFWLEGSFAFDGLVTVCNSPQLQAETRQAREALCAGLRGGRNVVTFEDNRLTRIVVGGTDQTALLHTLTSGRERGTAVTEFAVGCAQSLQPLDWSFNAVVNKVSSGIHVGIGMGVQMPHLAFVATDSVNDLSC